MKTRILCIGDSNTYGYDPRSPLGERYAASERWTGILAAETGWEVINRGVNGKTIPRHDAEIEAELRAVEEALPLRCVIIMLGSNDALTMGMPSAKKVADRMTVFLRAFRLRFPELPAVLVAPPRTDIPLAYVQDTLWELVLLYRGLSLRFSTRFVSAPSWDLPLGDDCVHFSPEAHRNFARNIREYLEKDLNETP